MPSSSSGRPRLRRAIEIALATGVCVFAGLGFTYKMAEFAITIMKDEVDGFGAVAVATYLMGMVPMLFLMGWAVVTGRFLNIEATKRRLFELDDEIERGGNHA